MSAQDSFKQHWAILNDFFADSYDYAGAYEELKNHLKQGEVMMFGEKRKETRLTCFFAIQHCTFKYAGREVIGVKPPAESQVASMLELFQNEEFCGLMSDAYPKLARWLQPENRPNAVFINWYDAPTNTKKPHGIGFHADDESSHEVDVIWSYTLSEEGGEIPFTFRLKKETSGFEHRHDKQNDQMVVMLPGCQSVYKHAVGQRMTNLKGKKITGASINLTFRRITMQEPPANNVSPTVHQGPYLVEYKDDVGDLDVIAFCKISQPHGYLSNWWPSAFMRDNKTFPTVEHYMMYGKAMLFGAEEYAEEIRLTASPAAVKKMGRSKKIPFDQKVWEANRARIVYEGNQSKFEQHPGLRDKLLATGDAILVEGASYDKVWGVGVGVKAAQDPKNWNGLNLLGRILMQLRSDLR